MTANSLFNNPKVQASTLIEYISSRSKSSSSVYVYDVAEQVGFGTATKDWGKHDKSTSNIVSLQTRAGAGLTLIGRLSQGTSYDTVNGTILTAYTTPSGLALMAPSFLHLPPASPTARLVIQVPTATPFGETLSLLPTLSPLSSVWGLLPENVAVLVSSTSQQSVDFAAIAYQISDFHTIHLFDHHSASREIGQPLKPFTALITARSIQDAVRQAGYDFFEYHGSAEAQTVVVLLNGPLALTLKAAIKANSSSSLGIVIINVLRPWDAAALQRLIPNTVSRVIVLDDVPNPTTQGSLYVDVFSALWENGSKIVVQGQRITVGQTQTFFANRDAFIAFVESVTHVRLHKTLATNTKKVLVLNIPDSPLSAAPHFIQDLFISKRSIQTRLLTTHDAFSRQGGITATRLLVSKGDQDTSVPITIALPLDAHSSGESDFLAILDHALLKTHSLLKHAKPHSVVLINAPWTTEEFWANISSSLANTIIDRELIVCLFNSKAVASKSLSNDSPLYIAVQNLLLQLVFLRIYLGPHATETAVLDLARKTFSDNIHGLNLTKINAHAWAFLDVVELPESYDTPETVAPLKDIEYNAIAVETIEGQTVVNGAVLTSWHDAAKHLLFPSVYAPDASELPSDSLSNPALRPEVPETTFLVTCTVNKRLTPLEYDRNVFHLEFDTSGTGLKYAIGEALGIHGWNDEQEVSDFCQLYGVDPSRLITIPVPSDETKVHTRTVLQALQQQIDLFGKPPKSFYTDLAEYATADVDRYALRFIGSPEGSSTFKKLSEKDTVTFADVLKLYPSARPGIERLCELIGDIKPRHYSIASAQSVVGDRVDLLVVTVDWMTPSGTVTFPLYLHQP